MPDPTPRPNDVTRILDRLSDPDVDLETTRRELFSAIYDDLRQIAGKAMRSERSDHTLRPTALVHEAYLRLGSADSTFENRAHFFGVAARAMRHILVDHARARGAEKRGGNLRRVTLDEEIAGAEGQDIEILALHDALEKLAQLDARAAEVVELRAFGGLTMNEVAESMGISKRSADRDWTFAQRWLVRALA